MIVVWFSVGTGVDISHLLFVDDTLLFCGANPKSSLHFTKLIFII
jgi:hypothetical protein